MADNEHDASEGDRNWLESFLRLFAEVNPGEGLTAVLLFVNIFLILSAYYVLKIVREALTIGGVDVFGLPGDQVKMYLSAFMAILLIGVVPAYGLLASRVNRIRLIKTTTILIIGCLVGFFVWGSATGVGNAIGMTFYIWLGIVNVFLIAQFWSFANDIYTEKQGKRLFAIIAIGQSAGAVLGPHLVKLGIGDIFVLMAASAAVFGLCLFLYIVTNRRQAQRAGDDEVEAAEAEKPLEKDGGFELVFKTKYLLLVAVMIFIANLVNQLGEFILANAAKTHAQNEASIEKVLGREVADEVAANDGFELTKEQSKALKKARSPLVGEFYGDFYFWVNVAGLAIQMFFVSRIFKYFGVRAALFVLPLVAFGGYAAIGLIGGLLVLRVAKTAENSTDYSLQNTVRQALFLPTSREAKYKAKAAIDTFFVRFGDTAAAGIIALGIHVLHFSATAFAFVNIGLCCVWLLLNAGIAREHKKLVPHDRQVNPGS